MYFSSTTMVNYSVFGSTLLLRTYLLTYSGTVEVVKKLVGGEGAAAASVVEPATEEPATETANGVNGTNGATKEDTEKAEVAAEVADTAEKLDSNEAKPVVA